jgi:leucine dehydrogenase
MAVFSHPAFDEHELVVFVRDSTTGLSAIVAVHRGGPLGMAGGGCRMWPYASDGEALTDALRLSRAMTYKLAIVGLPAGGGKAVIIGDARQKSEPLLEAFGAAVNRLGGRYAVGQDVGIDAHDLEVMRRRTPFVARAHGETAGPTGHGVFCGLEVAVRRHLARSDLRGLRVAVQGAGGVGRALARRLVAAGAKVWMADRDPAATARAVSELGVEAVRPEEIFDLEVDVFSPCALGGVLDDDTIPRLRCRVIAGGANNQLAAPRHAEALRQRGILYAPDFVINAGGVIAAAAGAAEDADEPRILDRVARVASSLGEVFDRAEARGLSTHAAAEEIARGRLEAGA